MWDRLKAVSSVSAPIVRQLLILSLSVANLEVELEVELLLLLDKVSENIILCWEMSNSLCGVFSSGFGDTNDEWEFISSDLIVCL